MYPIPTFKKVYKQKLLLTLDLHPKIQNSFNPFLSQSDFFNGKIGMYLLEKNL